MSDDGRQTVDVFLWFQSNWVYLLPFRDFFFLSASRLFVVGASLQQHIRHSSCLAVDDLWEPTNEKSVYCFWWLYVIARRLYHAVVYQQSQKSELTGVRGRGTCETMSDTISIRSCRKLFRTKTRVRNMSQNEVEHSMVKFSQFHTQCIYHRVHLGVVSVKSFFSEIETSGTKRMKENIVLIVGNSEVGKTSLVRRFVDGVFEETPGDFCETNTGIVDLDGQRVDFRLQDPLNRPYQTLCSKYYRAADAVIVVYDLTCRDSFDCVFGFVKETLTYCSPGCVYFIVGTKADLKEERKITPEETHELPESLERRGCSQKGVCFECSALTGENVDLLFKTIARKCEARRPLVKGSRSIFKGVFFVLLTFLMLCNLSFYSDDPPWLRPSYQDVSTPSTPTKKGGCSLI